MHIKLLKCLLLCVLFHFTNNQKFQDQKIESYNRCRFDEDCKINAFCFGNDDNMWGRCKCKDGFELNRNQTYYECLPGANLGDECEQDFQCSVKAGPMALCNKYKICECNELAHAYTDGMCYKTVNLTEFCLSDANCKLDDGRYGFCTDGYCECNLNEKPSADLRKCLVSKNLGDICNSEDDCLLIPNAICAAVCKCSIDYAISRDGTNCLKAGTTFGEPCIENDQCSKYLRESVCLQGNCTCLEGYHGYGTSCIKSAKIGETCWQLEQCIFDAHLKDKVNCVDGVCKCLNGEANNEYGCNIDNVANLIECSVVLNAFCLVLYYLL